MSSPSPIPVAIIGTTAYSRLLNKLVELCYNAGLKDTDASPLKTVAYYDHEAVQTSSVDGIPVINNDALPEILAAGAIGAFLLPQQPGMDIQKILFYLRKTGVPRDSIYIAPKHVLEQQDPACIDPDELLISYPEYGYIPYLEFHIEDACNMNCRACEHYSPLVAASEKTRTVYDDFERDLTRLKELLHDIGTIRILGGEPLMNPELPRYVSLCRRLYPEADVMVVTNALLLKKLPEETYETMREAGAAFMISLYPPLEHTIKDIIEYVKRRGVTVFCSDVIREFSIKQNLSGESDPAEQFSRCFQAGCVNLYKGRIAACFLPFTTHYFNEAFTGKISKSLPEDGAVDIYDKSLTTKRLKELLDTPFERCRYCNEPVNIPWSRANAAPELSDWVRTC